MSSDTRQCACRRPRPDMARLAAVGLDRYYVCPLWTLVRFPD